MTPLETAFILLIGLLAGTLGGLAGVGGSMIILPGLHFVFDHTAWGATENAHHLFMAAAMVTNIFVALPSARRHAKAGAVRRDLLPPLIASTVVTVLIGVWVSNLFAGVWLKMALAAFIAGYCLLNIRKLAAREPEPSAGSGTPGRAVLLVCGGITGFVGGVLGLGGGVMLVPLLQVVGRVGLRESIATSSSVIWISAVFGAGFKVATVHQHGYTAVQTLELAALLAPTAVVGALIGAKLVYALPMPVVRIAITVVLAVAATRLAGVWG